MMSDGDLHTALRSAAPDTLASSVRARLVVARAARRRTLRRVAFASALAGLMVLVGFLIRAAPPPGPTHMLIIQEQLADRLNAPADVRRQRGRAFGAWVQELQGRAPLTGGHQLRADGGHLVSAGGIEDRTSGIPPGEVVTGYLLVRASDEAELLRAARQCPILEHGGRVVVRRLFR
jgi:hypothetical protein